MTGVAQLDVILGPCPCDGCRHAVRCAIERLACARFSAYVHGVSAVRWSRAPRRCVTDAP